METQQMPKFEDSNAFVFWEAMNNCKDLQLVRLFCDSMKEWNRTLLKSCSKNRDLEKE